MIVAFRRLSRRILQGTFCVIGIKLPGIVIIQGITGWFGFLWTCEQSSRAAAPTAQMLSGTKNQTICERALGVSGSVGAGTLALT
jgi:hypothetical protein